MTDEQHIRDLITEWMRATADGNLAQLLALMDDEVIFLTPGQPPMNKDGFAKGFAGALSKFRIEATSDIQEIEVNNDRAYCWNHLTVRMIPASGGSSLQTSGHVLSVFRKNSDGRWVLFRDANLLGPPK